MQSGKRSKFIGRKWLFAAEILPSIKEISPLAVRELPLYFLLGKDYTDFTVFSLSYP